MRGAMRGLAKGGIWAGIGAVVAASYSQRPRPELEYPERNVPPDNSTPARLPHLHGEPESFLIRMGRMVVIPLVVVTARLYGTIFNSFEIEDNGAEELHHYVHNRKPGQALITVCNHTSVADEPVLFSCMLKAETIFKPHTMRWGACAQEICFANDFVSTFFGLGKALPVKRGNGVMQHNWTTLAEQVRKGHWVHVFPEAAVYQTGRLAALKWGVGRLVSFSDPTAEPPIILPFYHLGMEHTMPQHKVTNQLTTTLPTFFNKIRVKVGKPIVIDDLLANYRKEKAAEAQSKDPMYISAADKRFWTEVTARVRVALLELEEEMLAKYEPTTKR